ncbi:MAG: hypothetical protein NTV00_07145 [Methylococcales bacterium]|nr:hypothetical protein [Methylococcales bacterium]
MYNGSRARFDKNGIRFGGNSHCGLVLVLLTLGGLGVSREVYSADSQRKAKTHQQQKRLKVNPITDNEDAWMANAETDVYQAGTFENVALGYSARYGWDFSVALLNTQLLGSNNNFVADTFFNVAKTFDINDAISIVVGSQNGLALLNTQPQLWYSFSFIDNRYDAMPWLSLHGGPYLANAAITGTARQVGFIAGAELTLIENAVTLQMDYISGHHALSGATINLLLNITAHTQIYWGVSIPEQNSGNEFAGIMGFNFSSKNL